MLNSCVAKLLLDYKCILNLDNDEFDLNEKEKKYIDQTIHKIAKNQLIDIDLPMILLIEKKLKNVRFYTYQIDKEKYKRILKEKFSLAEEEINLVSDKLTNSRSI